MKRLVLVALMFVAMPAVAQEKVVHLSSINGQTGQSAAYGSKVIEGVNLAAKTINDAGGFTDRGGGKQKGKDTHRGMADSHAQAGEARGQGGPRAAGATALRPPARARD